MFNQIEKDENHPEGNLRVYYCNQHKLEGEKSPNKWTKTDQEQLAKKKEQKELEIEEKLNNQKGLFYLIDPLARAVEGELIQKKIQGIEYGCVYFGGRENGRNFWLLVPDTHPDLVNFKYKKISKRIGQEITRWTLKKQFYLIEGVDNLPLEAISPQSYEYNDMRDYWAKVVGLTDRITIVPFEDNNKPENQNEEGKCDICHNKEIKPGQEGIYIWNYQGKKGDKLHVCHDCYQSKEQEYLKNYASIYSYEPNFKKKDTGYIKNDNADCWNDRKGTDGKILKQKDCSHCQPWRKDKNNNELDTNFLLQYFQKEKIQRIIWDESKEDLVVEYQNGHVSTHHSIENIDISKGFPELHMVLNHLKRIGKNEISFSELGEKNNPNTAKNPQDNKVLLWLGLAGISLMVGGAIIWLILKGRKVRKTVN